MVHAIGVTGPGGPEALEQLDLAAEPLGPDQVRIEVHHATVNPTDAVIRSRGAQNGFAVPGMEVAGIVTEVGDDVDRPLAIGDAVIAIVVPSGEHGGYRADLVVPARSVAKIPSGLTEDEAATLPMNGLTAQLALDTLALPEGATVAVTGAAGTLGGYVVQLAKLTGLRVIADAKPADEDFVRECGADEVVPRGEEFVTAVRRHAPDGVDGLVDAAALDAEVFPVVRDGGIAVTVRGYHGDGTDRIRVAPIFVHTYAEQAGKLDRLAQVAADGNLTLRVADVLPAAKAAEAHHALQRRGARGKLVLQFS
jgi:NADPH:quinone reductase-like Zn-dependent oxidoreductase